MPLKQPPFILSLLRLYCCSASSLTYSYIRPSTYNWNIKSSSHSTILQQQQPFLPPPLSTQPLTSSSSSFHLKASFVYWGHYYTEPRELRNPPSLSSFHFSLLLYAFIVWFTDFTTLHFIFMLNFPALFWRVCLHSSSFPQFQFLLQKSREHEKMGGKSPLSQNKVK